MVKDTAASAGAGDIVDCQVHVWAPGDATLADDPSGAGVTGGTALRELCAAGVGSAVLVSRSSVYGYDSSYVLRVASEFPQRFRVVGPVDLAAPRAVDFVESWAADPRTVGLRLMVRDERAAELAASAASRRVLARIAALGMPLNVWAPRRAADVATLARAHPELGVVVDHTGIDFAPAGPPVNERLAAQGPQVLSLAALPNVTVKLTGLPALSREPYPYQDTWDWAARVIDAFGPARVLWGSDWTRVGGRYPDSLGWLVESGLCADADLARLLSGTAREVYAWPSSPG